MRDQWGEYTLCWNCSKDFPPTDKKCPRCGSTNANVDPDKAYSELRAQFPAWKDEVAA